MDPDCWYVTFSEDFPMEEADAVAKQISEAAPPGCFMVKGGDRLSVEVWGGGKSAANQKRRAATKNPLADWVKRSRFIVKGAEGCEINGRKTSNH